MNTTKANEVLDITQIVEQFLPKSNGLCNVFVKHTTAAVTTSDLDPGTAEDFIEAVLAMVPKLKYRHEHNPDHVGDHIMSSLIGPSVTVPVERGNLVLGTWQRLVLVELDGPREREVVITFMHT